MIQLGRNYGSWQRNDDSLEKAFLELFTDCSLSSVDVESQQATCFFKYQQLPTREHGAW